MYLPEKELWENHILHQWYMLESPGKLLRNPHAQATLHLQPIRISEGMTQASVFFKTLGWFQGTGTVCVLVTAACSSKHRQGHQVFRVDCPPMSLQEKNRMLSCWPQQAKLSLLQVRSLTMTLTTQKWRQSPELACWTARSLCYAPPPWEGAS